MKKLLLVLLIGTILTTGLISCQPYTFHGTVMQSPSAAPDFELMSNTGQKVSLEDFRGKLVILYFGYTFCPDVCPATLVEVAGGMDILGDDAEKVQVIMVSVDPARDTPEALSEYVAHFNPTFLGATGTEDEIAQLATLYGIFYEKHEGTAATGYLIDHTATTMVVDENGALKLIWPFGITAAEIAEDLEHMLP
ncbi:MAG: SCO family protein [Chloroflexi bacterium]|nr:SCO family protein [Chloroflexota bacterium]